MIVKIKHSSGNWDEEVDGSMGVLDLKALLSESCDIATEHQKLVFRGRVLKDAETLESSGPCPPAAPARPAPRPTPA